MNSLKITKCLICLTVFNFYTIFNDIFAQDTTLIARYVSLPYDLIKDEQIDINQNDLALIRKQLGETKNVYYYSFDIDSSSKDSIYTYQYLKKKTENFANNFQDTVLFFQNGGRKNALPPNINYKYSNLPIDSIFIFIDNYELYVNKIVGKKQIADSVHARQILVNDLPADKVEKILFDLKNDKITWADANKLYNRDFYSSTRGGDLGYFTQGRMIEPFDKLCFDIAIVGEYYRLNTQLGVHIVQVIDKKQTGNTYYLQTLSYSAPITPSHEDVEQTESKARKLIGESKDFDELKASLLKNGIEMKNINTMLFVPSEITEWAATAENGTITKTPIKANEMNSQQDKIFILGISKETSISDEDIIHKHGVEMRRIKKAKLLFENLKVYNSLESIASDFNVAINEIILPQSGTFTTSNEMVSNNMLQNKLFEYNEKALTEPIIGYNGIYIAYIFWKK